MNYNLFEIYNSINMKKRIYLQIVYITMYTKLIMLNKFV